MANGIVIYKSKYGATKKYAEWLAEELEYDIFDLSNVEIKQVLKYQNILLCGGIYASGINGLSFLKKHFEDLKNKNIAIFFCVFNIMINKINGIKNLERSPAYKCTFHRFI